jgi:hypothetical protein
MSSNLKADAAGPHLNQVHLSRRWCISPRTLERWRWRGTGARYLKVGGRILYRLEDIQACREGRGW